MLKNKDDLYQFPSRTQQIKELFLRI
jgi:hypothetical protein